MANENKETTQNTAIIPDGWKFSKLTLIAKIIMGQSPDSTYVNQDEEGVPFAQGSADFSSKYPVTQYWVTKPTKIVEKNDILMSVRAPVGDINLSDKTLCIGRGLAAIRFDDSVNNTLGWYLLAIHKNQLNKLAQGSTFLAVSSKDVSNIIISYPDSNTEQTKIAEILFKVDEAIEQTEATISKNERIKKGLMQDLFANGIDENGKIRSEETHEFKDSPLGRIPKEWDCLSIGDITSFVGSGITPTGGSEVYVAEGIVFIRSQNVYNDGIKLDDIAFITPEIFDFMKRTEVFNSDILLNITGASIGRCCSVPVSFPRANVNQHVCIIRLKYHKPYNAGFFSMILSSWIGQRQILSLNAGSNREGLNYQQVRNIFVPYPKDSEQRKIAEILNHASDRIMGEEKQLSKLLSIKAGLMQDLLTGKVRVTHLLNQEAVT